MTMVERLASRLVANPKRIIPRESRGQRRLAFDVEPDRLAVDAIPPLHRRDGGDHPRALRRREGSERIRREPILAHDPLGSEIAFDAGVRSPSAFEGWTRGNGRQGRKRESDEEAGEDLHGLILIVERRTGGSV